MRSLDTALVSLLFIVPLIHLLLSPFTKVEESFNLQATHDILVYGVPLPFFGRTPAAAAQRLSATYDHFTFPGAVPRTFTGAILLGGLSQPVVALVGFRHAQLVVRALLGGFNAVCLLVFWRSLRRAFGVGVARWWVGLLVTQFHVVYYLTRTLPNMYAFGLTTLASAFLLPDPSSPLTALPRRKQSIACLTAAAAVFRSEVSILLAATALYLLTTGQLTPRALLPTFAAAFLAALAVTVPLDSYLWQKPLLWPELWGFYYNTVLGQASSWGVSPWHYYWTSALPRLLANPLALPLIALSLLHPGLSKQARPLVLPSAVFIAVYSLQPHKETRFIFYVVPPLTAAAALGAHFLSARRAKSRLYTLAHLALLGSLLVSLGLSTGMLLLSSLNYPGGDALATLRAHVANPNGIFPLVVTTHADVLTCMTGLTLFTQNPAGHPLALQAVPTDDAASVLSKAGLASASSPPLLLVDKTEKAKALGSPAFWDQFEFALLEHPALALGTWDVIGVVQGYDGIEILRPGQGESKGDVEEAQSSLPRGGEAKVLGLGADIARLRQFIRPYTGGWWIGPRMSDRIRIMRNLKRL